MNWETFEKGFFTHEAEQEAASVRRLCFSNFLLNFCPVDNLVVQIDL
jgi:hypothetical protein